MNNPIKGCLQVLCTHLNYLCNVDLKQEHFRLAKFNKTDDNVVAIFWDALNKLTINRCDNGAIVLIKDSLKSLNYCNEEFYLHDENDANSRELLITLAFLISIKLNEIIKIEEKKSPFSEDFNMLSRNNCSMLYSHNAFLLQFCNKRYFQWVKERIRLNRKMQQDYEAHNKILLTKLNKNLNATNFTLNEVLAMCSDNYGNLFLENSERFATILENHNKWCKKENIFWEWMLTVQDLKEKSN